MTNLTYFNFDYNKYSKYNVTVNICGGLGNQLFQIATAYIYSKKYNKKLIFKYSEYLPNTYKLIRKSYWNTLFNNNLNVLSINDFNNINFLQYFEQEHFRYDELPFIEENILLNGYFQSFKYLDNDNTVRNFLRNLVYSSENFMYQSYNLYNSIKKYFTNVSNIICDDDDIVSMHFRRTDYILTPDNYHHILDLEYYTKAYNIVNKLNIVIFSDDIEWCKNNINNNTFSINDKIYLYFVDINIVEIEFILLSMIKHNIISNSTFSLMASYISYYDTSKKIVAPKQWLTKKQTEKYPNINQIYHNDITDII